MSKQRIESIDALRGFALSGIVFSHMIEQFIAGATSTEIHEVMRSSPVDTLIEQVVRELIQGKFFALFSILFGLSFSIQSENALTLQSDGKFVVQYIWKLVILFAIGLFHHLMYSGDILTIYAVFALFLLPFYKISSKWILLASLFFLLGAGRFATFAILGNEEFLPPHQIPDFHEKYLAALTSGTLGDVWQLNLPRMIDKFNYQLGVIGRAYLTVGYFLLGLWTGREHRYAKLESRIPVKLIVCCVAGIGLLYLIHNHLFETIGGRDAPLGSWDAMLALTSLDLYNTLLTILIALVFLLVFSRYSGFLSFFAPYGRMALTNYLTQTLLGVFILYHWGLGYIGKLTNTETVIIAGVVIVLQVLISKFWMARFYFGPLEWLWRSLTQIRFLKFVKKKRESKIPT
jgi:uncharacterized protein